jgi:hypothetical protein
MALLASKAVAPLLLSSSIVKNAPKMHEARDFSLSITMLYRALHGKHDRAHGVIDHIQGAIHFVKLFFVASLKDTCC